MTDNITNKASIEYFERNILTPRLLGSRQEGNKLILVGTCQVDHLVQSGPRYGFNVDHFLYDGLYAVDLPEALDSKYDAALVGLTLRTIVNSSVDGPHDVFHLQDEWSDEKAQLTLERAAVFIEGMIDNIRERSGSIPMFVMTVLEPSGNLSGNLIDRHDVLSDIRSLIRRINDLIIDKASRTPQAFVFDFNEAINFIGRAHLHDDVVCSTTHASIIGGFDDEHDINRIIAPISNLDVFDVNKNLQLLHAFIYNKLSDNIKILLGSDQVKIIITDLDDTMWRGIAAESDFEPLLRVEGWPLGYQEALLQYRARGGLLAICSKNDEAVTRDNFKKICGNRLSIDKFVSVKINWKPKSENIAEILSETNLLPENALFVDDNPREISEVRARFPSLRCLGGNHHDWRRIILRSPETQVSHISQESRERTRLVQSRIEREALSQVMSRDEWLRSLELRQSFTIVRDLDHPMALRMMELVNKTNQFNTTGHRWQPAEFVDLFVMSGCCIVTSLVDKNIDNGIIGVAIVRPGEIVQTVLSCRVFGLGAELALGSFATSVALKGCSEVRGRIIDTGRNATCRDYFDRMGYSAEAEGYVVSVIPSMPDWIDVCLPDVADNAANDAALT